MPLHTCPACACHVIEGACTCPHCGASVCAKTPRLSGAALLMGLALTGMTACAQDMYGIAVTDKGEDIFVDEDGDGFEPGEDDCNDDDPEIHPDAVETPGDGVDSNCNEDDDT